MCLRVRLYHCRVRQGALHCLLVVVKGVEKRTLYGYWSSFIPDAPIGGHPPLTLLTIILKDPSPKVHTHTHSRYTHAACALFAHMDTKTQGYQHVCNICSLLT